MSRFLYQSAQGSTAWLLAMWAVCFAPPCADTKPVHTTFYDFKCGCHKKLCGS